jgi:hypothetical protein
MLLMKLKSKPRNYREIFEAIDEFTALRLTATGASPAAMRTRFLPMTQHA